jgi:hypothetical protein
MLQPEVAAQIYREFIPLANLSPENLFERRGDVLSVLEEVEGKDPRVDEHIDRLRKAGRCKKLAKAFRVFLGELRIISHGHRPRWGSSRNGSRH